MVIDLWYSQRVRICAAQACMSALIGAHAKDAFSEHTN